MRLLIVSILSGAALWGQGAGGVQFRDWIAPAATAKPKIACGELRSLTSFELSVLSATVIARRGKLPSIVG